MLSWESIFLWLNSLMPIFNCNFSLIDFFSFIAGNSDGEESSQSNGEKDLEEVGDVVEDLWNDYQG